MWSRLGPHRVLDRDAKIDSVEPFASLKPTLDATATGHPHSRIDDLLSRNCQRVKLMPSAVQTPPTLFLADKRGFSPALRKKASGRLLRAHSSA